MCPVRAGKAMLFAVLVMVVVFLPVLSYSSTVFLNAPCSNVGDYYRVRVQVIPQAPYNLVYINTINESRPLGLVQNTARYDVVSSCDASLGLRVMVSSSAVLSASVIDAPVEIADPTTSKTAMYGVGMFAGLIVVIFLKSILG